jgi:hypothetical protein
MTPRTPGPKAQNGEDESARESLDRRDRQADGDARVDEIARLPNHAFAAQVFERQRAPYVAHDRVRITQEEEQGKQRDEQLKEQDDDVGDQPADSHGQKPSGRRHDVVDEAPEIDGLRTRNQSANPIPRHFERGKLLGHRARVQRGERGPALLNKCGKDDEPRSHNQKRHDQRAHGRSSRIPVAGYQSLVPWVDANGQHGGPPERREEGREYAEKEVAEQQHDAVKQDRRDALVLRGQRISHSPSNRIIRVLALSTTYVADEWTVAWRRTGHAIHRSLWTVDIHRPSGTAGTQARRHTGAHGGGRHRQRQQALRELTGRPSRRERAGRQNLARLRIRQRRTKVSSRCLLRPRNDAASHRVAGSRR